MKKLSTPILLILFNRPDLTAELIRRLSHAKPPVIYVACDGARSDRPDDSVRISQVKALIDKISWPCRIYKKYSDVNLGSRDGPASAIKWVLSNSESAIILEDDCLPSMDFFQFCEEMLDRYRGDKDVGLIAGNCFVESMFARPDTYFFSKYCITWGWATWADRWLPTYDIDILNWPSYKNSKQIFSDFPSVGERDYWVSIFDRVYSGEFPTAWDYQWFFANLINQRVAIYPSRNLITNSGSGVDATHTKTKSLVLDVPVAAMSFPLIEPKNKKSQPIIDAKIFGIYFKMSFFNKIRNKLRKIIS